MNNPDVSIILPVYNAEKYLSQCLESVVNQSFKNWELLIINDGSVDRSFSICVDFAKNDSRINIINIENSGASAARNTGLEKAKGKWITFVDSDDWIAPDYIEKMLHVALWQNTAAVFCNCFFVKESKTTPIIIYPENQILNQDEIIKRILIFRKLRTELWGKIFNSEFLTSLRLKKNIRIGEDLIFLLELFSGNSIITATIAEPLYYYRQLDSSQMKTGNKVKDVNNTMLEYGQLVEKYPEIIEKFPVEHSTFIVRFMIYLTRRDILNQFNDKYSLKLLKDNFKKAKQYLDPNEIRFVKLVLIHPLVAKIAFEINNLRLKLFHRKKDE